MRLRYPIVALLALAGCSGGGDNDNGPIVNPPTPTISLSVSPSGATAGRGTNTTATITLTRGGNYTGAVQLAASGVPSGVTVTFNPSTLGSSATTSTAVIAVGATAQAGTQSIQFTASGTGVSSASAGFALEIPNPAIALTVGAPTLSVIQGASGTIALTIARSGGFTGDVTVAASGLPAGVTVQPVTIASGSTSGTMTVSVAANAAAATSSITLTATGNGVTAQTSTVALTITAAATPSFSMTANPASASVVAGQGTSSTITVTRAGGFAGAVALAVTGAPAGMTATLNPASIAAGSSTSQLSITTTSAVAAGTYSLSVAGTGTGVSSQSVPVSITVTAAPGITVATSSATLSGTAGASVSTGVTLTRVGGYTGDVSLSVTGLPNGVTAAFAPATLSGATVASTLTLTMGASTTPGTYALVVSASGPQGGGTVSSSSNLSLTVTAAQGGYTLAVTGASLTQGGSGTSTVTITRTGSFTGAVNLSVSGLPSGVTGTFNPASVTGNSSTLTLTATTGAATGAFTATVTGTATGQPNVTASLTGSVTSGGGRGGGGNVSWTFCQDERFPLWFAVQNGSGAWTTVTPTGTTNRVYSFNMGSTGGVAYALPMSGGGASVAVFYMTATEMNASGSQECTNNSPTKSLAGTVAGLTQTPPFTSQSATVFLGFGAGSAGANGPFTVQGVPLGTTDLLAIRQTSNFDMQALSQVITPDRMILRRNVDYASTIPALDFGSSEAVAPASAQYTISNLSGEQMIVASSAFSTANGPVGSFASTLLAGTSPVKVYGVPNSLLQNGDMHSVMIAASTTTGLGAVSSMRIISTFNKQIADRTVSLGAQPPALSPTVLGTAPYVRLSATGSWQSDYPDAVGIGFTQTAGSGKSWSISVTRDYAGSSSSSWTMSMPDFSGVTGFQNSWGLSAGEVEWAFTATGVLSGLNPTTGQFSEGGSWRAASRVGTITP